MDSCCLAREGAAISLMEWILSLSENRALAKTNSRKRRLNGNARITPSITHLAGLWDKVWACNQGSDSASINSGEEFLCPQTATFCCYLHFIYKNLHCRRCIQANFHVSEVNWLVSGFAKQKQTLHLFLWTRSGHVFLTAVRCWHRRMFWGGVCWSESGWRCRLMIGRRSCDNGALCFRRFGEFVRCNLFSYWSALARASFCLVIKQSNADLPLTSRQHAHTNSHTCTDI